MIKKSQVTRKRVYILTYGRINDEKRYCYQIYCLYLKNEIYIWTNEESFVFLLMK